MIERHRKFTIETENVGEPPTFELAGETFTCVEAVPIGVQEAFGVRRWAPAMIMDFMRGVLVDEDVERFEALARDKKIVVTSKTVSQIVNWLVALYIEGQADRPSMPLNGSAAGRRTTGDISEDGLPSPDAVPTP